MAAADSRLGQLIAASRPSRPWLHLTVPPWWARVLIAAGARPAPDPDTGKGQELTAEAAPNADPTRADQKDAKLTPRRADLADANLYGANLRGADLRGADLRDANLADADLHSADLVGADLVGANLRGANLIRAKLRDANLMGADLSLADLSHTNLNHADLQAAKLRDANLIGANLVGANLVGADLRDANLGGADLVRARWSIDTRWPVEAAERVREASREISPGLWEFIGPGRDRDRAELPVP